MDDEDYPAVAVHSWREQNGYAIRREFRDGKRQSIRMHREIIGASEGVEVDHRDGNKLDNRRKNLRVATKSQNQANARKHRDNKSGFKGVEPRG